ncbi:MAG: cation-translocating P-type ATPase [Opitutales bacterium]
MNINKSKEETKCCCSAKKEQISCCGASQESSSCCSTSTKAEASSCSSCCGSSPKKGNEGLVLIISAICIVLSFCIDYFSEATIFKIVLNPAWIAVYFCAVPLAKSAFKAFFIEKKIKSSLLVTVAMLAAGLLQILELLGITSDGGHCHNYIFVIAEIAFLMKLGGYFEERTINKSRSAIEALSQLIPTKALKKIGENFVEVDAKEIEISDILAIRPNSVIPVDSIIIKGQTCVNESSMTGESLPVDKSINDKLMGGSFNTSNYIEVKAISTLKHSAISKIVEITKEAEGKKAPISKIADKFASLVVPFTIMLSILVFCGNFYIYSVGLEESLIRALTILIVLCPCAFVLATPTAIAAAIGNLAKNGLLVKSGEAIETLAKVKEVFFDKTGTLTTAKIQVEEVFTLGLSNDELLYYAGSAEKFSEHPIAKAISEFASKSQELASPQSTISKVGIGVAAQVDGKLVEVLKYEPSIHFKCNDFANKSLKNSKAIVCVVIDNQLVGAISLSDSPRQESPTAISQLKELGYKTSMLTGDTQEVAKALADKVGIENVYANLSPAQKQDILKKAQEDGSKISMIGDGINDAPALATADVSMAIAEANNDIAVDTASISIVGGNLAKIPFSLEFSKKVLRTIKLNIAFSIIWNLATTSLASLGYIDPALGAILHNVSSIIVVLNSASLLKVKPKKS